MLAVSGAAVIGGVQPMLPAAGLAIRLRPGPVNAKKADPYGDRPSLEDMCGGVLLSREASLAVPSALRGLTSGFGMGPGVSPSLWPPQLYGIIGLVPGRIPGTAQ